MHLVADRIGFHLKAKQLKTELIKANSESKRTTIFARV